MARKKIVREPVEKLSSDNIVEITEDSSSEEESDLTPIVKPSKTKKPRTPKQLANDQRLRDRKKKNVIEPVNELDKTTHPVNPVPVADDKPLTKKEMLELMSQMNKPAPVKKPRKPRASKAEMVARKAEKIVIESPVAPPPTPPPTPLKRAPPQMMFV